MNKKIIVFGIFTLLIAVGLSGCNESNNSSSDIKKRFIGTWEYVDTEFFTARHTYYENGTMVQNISNSMIWDNNSLWYNYEIKDGKICFEFIETKAKGCMIYKFSEDYTLLTLESIDSPGHPETFRKTSS